MIPYLAAAASALMMWAAFPPLDWGLLAFVAPAPLLWALRQAERGAIAVAIGFSWGVMFFGLLLYWIFILGAVAWIPLTFWLAMTSAAYGLLVWAFRLWPPGRWWLVVVGGWTLWEFVRSRWPYGGFPWGSLGYAAGGGGGFIGSVQWIGPSGWTVLSVAVAAGIVLVVEDRQFWRYVVDPAVVVLMLVLAGSIFAPSADGPPIRVAIIQGDSPCPRVHCQNEKQRIYESHLELTRALPAGGFDLVVWPENSTGSPFEPDGNPEVRTAIDAEAERLGAHLLISGTRSSGPDHFLNVNMVFTPGGLKLTEYRKRHPVPFGEFVPLRGVLSFIPQLEQVPRDMVRGDEAVVFPLRNGVVGSVISFEGAFSDLVRSEARAGAQILVVATNESSFGRGPASDQLIAMARVNAAAIGQDLVHAAITGKSAIITANGEIVSSTELFTPDILIGELHYRTAGQTLFTRLGDWVLYLALFASLLALSVPGEGRPERQMPPRRREAMSRRPNQA